jgi:hypothetical protein
MRDEYPHEGPPNAFPSIVGARSAVQQIGMIGKPGSAIVGRRGWVIVHTGVGDTYSQPRPRGLIRNDATS